MERLTRDELKKKLSNVSDFELSFNLEYLIAERFVVEKNAVSN